MAPRQISLQIMLLMVLMCVVWGGAQPAVRIASQGMPPLLQAGLRSVVSGALLAAWCLLRGMAPMRFDRTIPWGLLSGGIFAGEFICQYTGLGMTNVSRGVLFIYSAPFVAAAGAHFLIPAERLTPLRASGLLLAFLGLLLAFWRGLSAPDPRQIVGDLLCLIMGCLWGCDMLVIKLSPLRAIAPERVLFYSLTVSAPILLAASWLAGEPGIVRFDIPIAAAFGYTAVIVSFISYTVNVWLLQRYPAASLGSFIFLSPIVGVAIAGLMLGETLPPELILALALIAAGIWLVNRRSLTSESRTVPAR